MNARSFDPKNLPGSVWKYKNSIFMVIIDVNGDFVLTECYGRLAALTPRTQNSILTYLNAWKMQYLDQFTDVFDPESVASEKW